MPQVSSNTTACAHSGPPPLPPRQVGKVAGSISVLRVSACYFLQPLNCRCVPAAQGGIDYLENPMVAAVRELQEETGITSARIVAAKDEWLQYDSPTCVRSHFTGRWVRYKGQTQKWCALQQNPTASPHHAVQLLFLLSDTANICRLLSRQRAADTCHRAAAAQLRRSSLAV